MDAFASLIKKRFNELLSLYGYSTWRNVYYKIANDCMCIFISIHGTYSKLYDLDINIDMVPYCAEIKDYNIDDDAPPIDIFINSLMSREDAKNFEQTLYSSSEETANKKLELMLSSFNDVILPYIDKCIDLNFYYDEYKTILENAGVKRIIEDPYFFGLSVKLHQFDDAILHVDSKLSQCRIALTEASTEVMAIESGNIPRNLLIIQKIKPNIVETELRLSKGVIKRKGEEIEKFKLLREALVSKEINYLDNYIKEIEHNSREYINKMLRG